MDPLESVETTTPTTAPQTEKKNPFVLIGTIIIALLILGALFITLQTNTVVPTEPEVPADTNQVVNVSDAVAKSAAGDPKPLQDFMANQIASGVNDDATKAAVYWVTHRYFDNGGNIYEIYDFIETTPAVAFLKEAEAIYPEIFATIKTTEVRNWSYESLMALLAYYETIDRAGYANISIWSTAANKYAEQAFKNIPNETDTPEFALERKKYFDMVAARSYGFLWKAHAFIVNNTMKTGDFEDLKGLPDTMLKDDILVGLNQYASAIQNLKGAGAEYPTGISPIELFEFNSKYAEEFVPRLYLFTNYLYATALVYGGDATVETVALPLGRAVAYMRQENNVGPGSIQRIIKSKTSVESGVFQYSTTKKLAELSPEFKAWLMDSGWTAADF